MSNLKSLLRDARWSLAGKPTAHYIGWLGHGNFGDELLYWATQRLFQDKLWLRSSRRNPRIEPFLARRQRAVILGGGTLIRAGQTFLDRARATHQRRPGSARIVFGTGVADAEMWEKWGRSTDYRAWVSWLEECDFVSVRGPLSIRFLREWGLKRPVEAIGDPALAYRRPSPLPKTDEKKIGVNFGPTQDLLFGGSDQKVQEFGAGVLRRLSQDGWRISLFPMSQKDLRFMEETARLAGVEVRVPDWNTFDPDAFLDKLEDQTVFLGEKLHSVVLAACAGTPPIALVYRTKCLDFMSSIEREHWTLRTDRLDSDAACKLVEELRTSVGSEQEKLLEVTGRWRQTLDSASARVSELAMSKGS